MSLGAGRPPGPRVLAVQAMVAETYQHVGRNLQMLVFLAALPAAIRLVAEVVTFGVFETPLSPLSQLTMLLLTTLLMASFSVAWHRFTLLGEVNKQGMWQFVFERREALFFLYSLMMMLPIILAALSARSAPEGGSLLPPVLMGVAVFVFVRLSMLLPAVAVDGDSNPRHVWQLTQGHFWRILATLLLVALPAEMLALMVLVLLSGDSAVITLLARMVAIVLEFLVTAIVVTALSFIYRTLNGPPTQLPVSGAGSST